MCTRCTSGGPFLRSGTSWIHDSKKGMLVFRDIARSTDSRTAIFSVLPALACANNLPIAIIDHKYTREITVLATCASSFVLDYVARQKVGGTHMNFFILKQLPILPPR